MKTATKIRWLLFLVTIGLFATSLTARWASTKLVKLYDIADEIKEKINEKELQVFDYLSVKHKFNELKKLDTDANLATQTLSYFSERNIFFQTYKKNNLVFWSDAVIPSYNPTSIKEGISFVEYENGWYEVIKKSDKDFFVLFFIPIKQQLPFNNQYLNASNSTEFIINRKSIQIADIADSSVVDIESLEGKYLFSIKRINSIVEVPYSNIEIFMWCFGLFTLFLLINSVCNYYASIGNTVWAVFTLFICIALLRYLGLKYHFPDALYSLKLFDPSIYASNFYFSSLADLCLNIFGFLWLLIFIHGYKTKLFKPIKSPYLGYPILVYGAIFIIALSFLYSDVFFGLVFNSNINFKVSNLVNLNFLSFLSIFMLMVALLCYYLVIDILVHFSLFIKISVRNKLILLGALFIAFNIYQLLINQYSVYFIFIFVLILLIGKLLYQNNPKIIFPAILFVSFVFATIVSLKLNTYDNFKDQEIRKKLLLKLESVDDPYALISFKEIEKDITEDATINKLLKDSTLNNTELSSWITTNYLAGYLSKFDYKIYLFNVKDSLLNYGKNIAINRFRNQVEQSSIKITNNFYRLNNTFGTQNYFAILPIRNDSLKTGTLVLELTSKQLEIYGAFPQLLQNGKINQQSGLTDYSYAFYDHKKLVNQYGTYVYDLVNTIFNGMPKKFVVLKQAGYEHVIYKPTNNTTIVVTHTSNTFWRELASLSFFFIIFLLFALIAASNRWLISTFSLYKLNFEGIKTKLLSVNNQILYKTRIQIALVLAVVTSLLIIGIITFSYITIQYKEQQQDIIKSKIKTITTAFQESIYRESQGVINDTGSISFEEFSKMYNTDLNLFDVNGKLLYSTQYKIYAIGLIADRMNEVAFLNLNIKNKSEFIQDEHINMLKYTSAYMPVKNIKNDVIAYLQLPYFSNQDYNQKIGSFLNLLINIYVLVFVAVAFFAFVVANQITSPLSLIQESISKTVIGRKNKPIEWKRKDEIGSLITEYNAMIETLEDNANKMAQSERETAWREMAKQVAHEIKNPLTPLKLGIQMLERAWREKDERFDEKFQKFGKSFLEQIDSLSRIASEFSNFAKMPELKLERVDLLETFSKAIEIYQQMDKIQIVCDEQSLQNCFVRVDKDQLMRSFNNLLKNAIEAIPEHKQGIIKILGIRDAKKIEIIIKDNGSGIPLNSRDNIFVPNFTTKSSGTGLGLAFVKQAIQNVNGNIYFTTEIDVGTTFYITLPLVN
ncbi:sensor histidine kinase [Pedobacter alpinus]|uniref:histidine kinase n=1 Tax=Pedobacter alpinus TaxID=1590643 RepID=A0ABW5TQU1_9SPHI